MLRFLRITHLAVIDAAEVEFGPGLNVLTGETGAGKSILVEAVGLLLGGRASADMVRTGEDAATIEAIFESAGEELLIKREITAQGRSRAFVNGALATAAVLRDLSSRLVELHGQHEHQTLLDPTSHLQIVDAFGGLGALRAPVAAAFDVWQTSGAELSQMRKALAERQTRQDFAAFQLGELERAGLTSADSAEDAELASTRQVLASAERVQRLCEESYAALYESDGAVLAGLGGVWRRVADLAALDPKFSSFLSERDGIKSQLEELAAFLRHYGASIEASPERLQQVDDRLALLERLKKKYGPTLRDCVERRDALRRELAELERGDERIVELEREHNAARNQYLEAAKTLTAARRKAGASFARAMERIAGELAMEQTRFDVRFAADVSESEWSSSGVDRAEFYVSPNPGEDLRPLARIVSGGELSRLMLAIKTLTATTRLEWNDGDGRPPSGAAPGLIFDEVDAGIGGRVAEVVGRKLYALGSAFQVLCITHLPQIAAYADAHYAIEKRVERGRTRTTVSRLQDTARVEEIGRMLGGDMVTDGLRASAQEMLRLRVESRTAGAAGERPKSESEGAKAKGRRRGA
ncbi:MAG TPA: DNA repair protein RecN [Vicinamibacterales bacterium]|nr:DNA repair protein RecN [Vicinamibacterales bacterium]